MTQWVITGYSHKMDGILLVVEAETEAQALDKGAKAVGAEHHPFEYEGGIAHGYCPDAQVTEDDMREELEDASPSYWWAIEIAPLKLDTNLYEAVQW